MLDVAGGAKAWTIFALESMTPRNFPMVSPLDAHSILIAGGYG